MVSKLKSHQRISQWPGISVLSHKNRLAKNLMLMQKHHPEAYNFFPLTYLLPNDLHELKKQFRRTENVPHWQPPTFIVKPCHDCQGRGIYLINQFADLQEPEQSLVAQTYIDDPFLVDGLKFDLRLYVLLYGVNPLRIYLFDDGLARFATTPYKSAKQSDISDLYMHLTNYSINKNSSNYVKNEKEDGSAQTNRPCHKRSLKEIYRILQQKGFETAGLKKDINDLVVKTIITGQNYLAHVFRSCHADDFENQMCFQILGFDVMIDSKLKPWLIEINQSPSFATDSAFDSSIKKRLLEDTFALLNLTAERRSSYFEEREKQYFERMMGQTKQFKLSALEKEQKRLAID